MKLINKSILALLITLIFSCTKKDEPIPDPTLSVSTTEITLGSVDITTKYSLVLSKNGTGNITYTVSNDAGWYSVSKNSGSLTTSSVDTLKLTMVSSLLKKGENMGSVTITPTINNKPGAPIKVNVRGSYNAPTVVPNTMEVDLGAIDVNTKYNLVLTKSGVGTVSYNIVGEANSWLSTNKTAGNLNTSKTDTIKLAISRSKLKKGAIETYITLEPTSNDVKIENIKIKIKGTYTAPTLTPNATAIDLGNVTDQTKSSFTISPKGVGSISYTITSSKAWLSVDKASFTFATTSANTVNLAINTKEMVIGDNDAVLTITPTINEQKEAPIQISVKGNLTKITNLVGDYTLTKNETWSGTVNVAGVVTVPSGITLTVKPGTVVNFKQSPEYYSIKVKSGAKLDIKGTADQRITFKSSAEKPTDFDWYGLSITGTLEAEYCIFANAGSAISSFQSTDYSIKNCLFYNNFGSISTFTFLNKLNVLVKNCTFTNSSDVSFFTDYSLLSISYCNFNNTLGHDLEILGSNNKMNISQSNFSNKDYSFLYNLRLGGNTDLNNFINADNCYNLKSVSTMNNGNVFEQSNPSSARIANAGCGFEDKFTQSIPKPATQQEMNIKKAKLEQRLNQLKAKYSQK